MQTSTLHDIGNKAKGEKKKTTILILLREIDQIILLLTLHLCNTTMEVFVV